MWIRWLEAQEVPVVEVIVEFIHSVVETSGRFKDFVLAAGHRCNCLWGIFPYALACHDYWSEKIRVIRRRLVITAGIVQNLRQSRRKSQRMDHNVAVRD